MALERARVVALAFALTATGDERAPVLRFAKPRLLACGFADEPRLPLAADVDGDGFADLVAVYPDAPGIVDVARNLRGGKLSAPEAVARDLGVLVAATTRPLPGGRTAIVVTRSDGERRIVSLGADGAWTVETEPATSSAPASVAAAATTQPFSRVAGGNSTAGVARRVSADFDGDGAPDELIDDRLVLASDPDHPIDLPFLRDLPPRTVVFAGDVNGDRRADVLTLRRDDAWRVGRDLDVVLTYTDGTADADGDGLDDAAEKRFGTDPLDADTDHDGLLDGWEVKGEGVLDLPALGASPMRKDCFVYVQRVEDADGAACKREMARVVKTWADLPCRNPDGSTGIALHPIWLGPIPLKDGAKPWWDQGNANLPSPARGLAHYMVVYNAGGGQAGELGDMGGCGAHALWATFLHEFGHQVGLSHSGSNLPGLCPTYTSLMSYAYSYSFGGDANAIHYSNGDLASLVLNETRLDERVVVPIDRLRFLEKAPYSFRLQADGDATKVDWNRNGVFDTKPVRADITDVYGASGGERFPVGKTVFAPALVEHAGKAQLFGVNRERKLTRRECLDVGKWTDEKVVGTVVPTGDPWATSFAERLHLFVPTAEGVVCFDARAADDLDRTPPSLLPDSQGAAVSAVTLGGRLLVLLWDGADKPVRVLARTPVGRYEPGAALGTLTSTFPPAAIEDPATHELLVASGARRAEGAQEKPCWRLTRFRAESDGSLREAGARTVGGDKSGWCGDSRPVLLVETGEGLGPSGRLHFIARGTGSGEKRNGCFYEAITIGDATQDDGWRLRRFFDEWTTTSSPIAACWHDGDLILAFRWFGNVHGDEDENLLVSHKGLGIDSVDMRDFDDVKAIAEIGLERSILWRAR